MYTGIKFKNTKYSLAANCFWDNILKQKKNADYFKVAVGKYTHDIAIKDNAFTQIVDVSITQLKKQKLGLIR